MLKWSGPNGVTGFKKRFNIDTSLLQPQQYKIQLTVIIKDSDFSSHSSALLHIKSKAKIKVPNLIGKSYQEVELELEKLKLHHGQTIRKVSDNTPDTVISQKPKAGTMVESGSKIDTVLAKAATLLPPVKYIVKLKSNKKNVNTGEDIVFKITTKPFSDNVKYRYHFGDLTPVSGWSSEKAFVHHYTKAGSYKAYIEIQTDSGLFESNVVPILVVEEVGIIGKDNINDIPPLWILIGAITSMIIVSGGIYYMVRIKPEPEPNRPIKNALNIDFHLREGLSQSEVKTQSEIVDNTLTINVIKDSGWQRADSYQERME